MKDEGIKAVEMTRQIRDRMCEETKDLDQEEFLRYVKQRSAGATRNVEEGKASVAEDASRRALR